MKKMVLVIALIAVAFGGSAIAQDLPWQNNVGIYLDEQADVFCGTADSGAVVQAYLILTNMTEDHAKGYELKLTFDGPAQLAAAPVWPANAVNVGSKPGEQIVGYDVPVFASGSSLILATYLIYVPDGSLTSLAFIDHIYFPSIAGVPSYLLSDDTIVEMRQSTGGPYDPVFILNGDCMGPVAVEETTFDNLKSLYR